MSFANISFRSTNFYPNSVRIGLMNPDIAQNWARRVVSDGTTVAPIKKGDTINHTTAQPIASGLFCQRIFGPCIDYTCACGHEKIRIHVNINVSPPVCPDCHVEWTESSVRRQRLGLIELISPVTHKWFSDSRNYIPILTGITVKTFKSVKECKAFFPLRLERGITFFNPPLSEKLYRKKSNLFCSNMTSDFSPVSDPFDFYEGQTSPTTDTLFGEKGSKVSLAPKPLDEESIEPFRLSPQITSEQGFNQSFKKTGSDESLLANVDRPVARAYFNRNQMVLRSPKEVEKDYPQSGDYRALGLFAPKDRAGFIASKNPSSSNLSPYERRGRFNRPVESKVSKTSSLNFSASSLRVHFSRQNFLSLEKTLVLSLELNPFVDFSLNNKGERNRRAMEFLGFLSHSFLGAKKVEFSGLKTVNFNLGLDFQRKKQKKGYGTLEIDSPELKNYQKAKNQKFNFQGLISSEIQNSIPHNASPLTQKKRKQRLKDKGRLVQLFKLNRSTSTFSLKSREKVEKKGFRRISKGYKPLKQKAFYNNWCYPIRPSFTQPEDYRRQFLLFMGTNGLIKDRDRPINPPLILKGREEPNFLGPNLAFFQTDKKSPDSSLKTQNGKKGLGLNSQTKPGGYDIFSQPALEVYFSETKCLEKEQTIKQILYQTGGGGFQKYLSGLNLPSLVYFLQNDLFEIAPRLTQLESTRRVLPLIINQTLTNLTHNFFLLKKKKTTTGFDKGDQNRKNDFFGSSAEKTLLSNLERRGENTLMVSFEKIFKTGLELKINRLEKKYKDLKKEYKNVKKISSDLQNRRSTGKRRYKLAFQLLKTMSNPAGMTLSSIPVLPPGLRPIIDVPKIGPITADLNIRYRGLIFALRNLRELAYVDFRNVGAAQASVQEAVDDLLYTGGKIRREKSTTAAPNLYKSLAMRLKGKHGRFRANLLGKRVDYSGRSVIVVGPTLKIHQCGLPFEIALKLFNPFLIRRLIQKGLCKNVYKAKQVLLEGKFQSLIWALCREVMLEHLVLLNRAPTLHRLGVQAFMPILVSGKAILLHPLVCTGFNADFDGDQMGVHLPLFPQARAEAWKLMWSRNNFLSPASGEPILLPSQDMVLGCYYLTESSPSFESGKFFWSNSRIWAKGGSGESLNQKPMELKAPFDVAQHRTDLKPSLLPLWSQEAKPFEAWLDVTWPKESGVFDFKEQAGELAEQARPPEGIGWFQPEKPWATSNGAFSSKSQRLHQREPTYLLSNPPVKLLESLPLDFNFSQLARKILPQKSQLGCFLGQKKPFVLKIKERRNPKNLLEPEIYKKRRVINLFPPTFGSFWFSAYGSEFLLWISLISLERKNRFRPKGQGSLLAKNQNYRSDKPEQLSFHNKTTRIFFYNKGFNLLKKKFLTLNFWRKERLQRTILDQNKKKLLYIQKIIWINFHSKTKGGQTRDLKGSFSLIKETKKRQFESVFSNQKKLSTLGSERSEIFRDKPSLRTYLKFSRSGWSRSLTGLNRSLTSANYLPSEVSSPALEGVVLKPLGSSVPQTLNPLREQKTEDVGLISRKVADFESNTNKDGLHQWQRGLIKNVESEGSNLPTLELRLTPFGITELIQPASSKKSFFQKSLLSPINLSGKTYEIYSVRTTIGRLLFNEVLQN